MRALSLFLRLVRAVSVLGVALVMPVHGNPPSTVSIATKPKAPPKEQEAGRPALYWHHLMVTLETFRVRPSDFDALQTQGGTEPLYDRLKELVKGRKAFLESVMAVPVPVHDRAESESVEEFIHAVDYDPPTAGRPYSFPIAYEMRPLGEKVELQITEVDAAGIVHLQMAQEMTQLVGQSALKAEAGAPGELVPAFAVRAITASMRCWLDAPTFAGTLSAPWKTGVAGLDDSEWVGVSFVRVRPPAPVAESKELEAKVLAELAGKHVRMVYRFYSLPREKAHALLQETVDAEVLLARVRALPAGEGKLERLISMATRPGSSQEGCHEAIEWRYGVEFNPPGAGKSGKPLPGGVNAFEGRELGWEIPCEPVVDLETPTVKVHLAPQLTTYLGAVGGHPHYERYPEQPLFSRQMVRTAVVTPLGRQCFLGTMTPAGDTGAGGRKDDGRVWLAFLKATLE